MQIIIGLRWAACGWEAACVCGRKAAANPSWVTLYARARAAAAAGAAHSPPSQAALHS